jgi:hypothetical protein
MVLHNCSSGVLGFVFGIILHSHSIKIKIYCFAILSTSLQYILDEWQGNIYGEEFISMIWTYFNA